MKYNPHIDHTQPPISHTGIVTKDSFTYSPREEYLSNEETERAYL